jgi:hypothetical protein
MSASHTGLFETKTNFFLFLPFGLVEYSDVAADKNVRAPVLIGTVVAVLERFQSVREGPGQASGTLDR